MATALYRTAALIFLASGLLFAPWMLVFPSALFAVAVFSWYLEFFFIGAFAAIIAGVSLWKMFLSAGIALLFCEILKTRLASEKFFAKIIIALTTSALFTVTAILLFFI